MAFCTLDPDFASLPGLLLPLFVFVLRGLLVSSSDSICFSYFFC